MKYFEYSQAIAESSIASQKGQYYEPLEFRTPGPSNINDIMRLYKVCNNPVTKSVYKRILINRINAGELG